MRLVMLGTGPFAVPTLEALAASPHEVRLVVARPPRGRGAQASPLQRAGETLGLGTWTPESVNLPDSQARLASLRADLLVVCDYGEILRPATLATTRLGGINLHGSLLPKYRGAAPVQCAILDGETETGNTVIQMTPGLDAGPCLAQEPTPIDPDEDAADARNPAGRTRRAAGAPRRRRTRRGDRQANRTESWRSVEGSPAGEGRRRDRLEPFCDRDQKPGACGPALAPGLHVLASQRRPTHATQHRPRPTSGPWRARFSERARCGSVTTRLLVSTGNGLLEILEPPTRRQARHDGRRFPPGNRVSVGDRLGPA